ASQWEAHAGGEYGRQWRPETGVHSAYEYTRQHAGEAHRRLHAAAAVLHRLRPDLVPERDRPASASAGDHRSTLAGAVARERRGAELGRVRRGVWLQSEPADGARTGVSSLVGIVSGSRVERAFRPAFHDCGLISP